MPTRPGRQTPSPVHPAFKKILFGFKVARFALWLAAAGIITGSAVMLVLATQSGQPFGVLVGILFLLVLIPLYPLSRLLRTRLYEPALRCARLLQTGTPRPMRLKYLGAGDLGGQYVALWQPGQTDSDPAWGFASVVFTTRKGTSPGKSEPVMAYVAAAPNTAVVFCSEKSMYWGELLDAQALDAGWRQTKRFLLAIFVLMAIICCAIGLEPGLKVAQKRKEWRLAAASLEWPRVQGVIMFSGAEPTSIPRDLGSTPAFEARARYVYEVHGETFQGERLRFGLAPDIEREAAIRAVTPYPPGARVDLAYDPANPALSVLEPGHVEDCALQLSRAWRKLLVLLVLTGSIFAGAGFFLILQFRKSRRQVEILLTRLPEPFASGRPG